MRKIKPNQIYMNIENGDLILIETFAKDYLIEAWICDLGNKNSFNLYPKQVLSKMCIYIGNLI